jgi:hypothetical protein
MVEETWLIRDVRDVLNRIEDVGLGFRAPNPRLLIVIFTISTVLVVLFLRTRLGIILLGLLIVVWLRFTS